MTKEDFALLRESLEQAAAFKQREKAEARLVIKRTDEDANNRRRLVLKNGSIIEHIPCEGEVIRGKGWTWNQESPGFSRGVVKELNKIIKPDLYRRCKICGLFLSAKATPKGYLYYCPMHGVEIDL